MEQLILVIAEEPEVCSSEAGGVGATESGGLLIPSSDMLKKIPSKTRKRGNYLSSSLLLMNDRHMSSILRPSRGVVYEPLAALSQAYSVNHYFHP